MFKTLDILDPHYTCFTASELFRDGRLSACYELPLRLQYKPTSDTQHGIRMACSEYFHHKKSAFFQGQRFYYLCHPNAYDNSWHMVRKKEIALINRYMDKPCLRTCIFEHSSSPVKSRFWLSEVPDSPLHMEGSWLRSTPGLWFLSTPF